MKKVTTILALAGCTAIASAQPGTFLDLGIIGGEGSYTFDTINSYSITGISFDTEMGLWDSTGTLLAANDDIGWPFESWSSITEMLTAGEYYIGISEWGSYFVDGFLNINDAFEDGEGGILVLNIDGLFAGQVSDSDFSLFEQETAFFKVTVVPAPSALALLGLGGIVAGRRRR